MDPQEDLHGPMFGSDHGSERGTEPNYYGENPPPIFRSGPQAPIPYPTSTVRGVIQAPPHSLHLPLGGNGAQPTSPYVPPRFRGNVPPPPPFLPSAVAGHVNPPSAAPMQHRNHNDHHHTLPSSSAASLFVPPMENAVRPLPSNTSLNPSLLSLRSIALPLPSPKRDLSSPEVEQIDAEERSSSNNSDESAVAKRSIASKTPPVNARQTHQYEESDVRAKAPENRDEVKIIQQVLEPAIRSFALVTGRTPPEISLWKSYEEQRGAFQRALDIYWWLDEREGSPPELAGIGPWYGPIITIVDAPLVITEADLGYATHPAIASHEPEPGTIAWMERAQNFDYLLQNQFQPSDHAQPTVPGHHRVRTSISQPTNLQVDQQVIHEEVITPHRVGALLAREIEGGEPANNGQNMLPMQPDEAAEPPYWP